MAHSQHVGCLMQVGVMHTNYKELGKRIAGPAVCPLVHGLVSALCGIHCHKVHPPCPVPSCGCLAGLSCCVPLLMLCPVQHPLSPGVAASVCRLLHELHATCGGPLLMKAPCSNPCIELHLSWPVIWCCACRQLCCPCW